MPSAPLSDAFALFQAGRVPEGLRVVESHAAAGNGDALFTLADMYWRGAGVPQDLGRGRELFRRSSDAGQPMGVRAWTNLLASGIAGERDWSNALDRLQREGQSDLLRRRMFEVIRQMDLTPSGDPTTIPAGKRLSERPDVQLFEGAFTKPECEFLIFLAEPTYGRSIVVIDGRDVPDPVRTSDGSTIHWLIEDPATHAINRRLAALTQTSVDRGEPLQILRYRSGQEYRPHFDWLGDANRRMMTALIYLNDDYSGGETAFTKTGLTINGRRGDVLVFSSMTNDGSLEPLSEHAGLPVTNGIKYLASRWIRENRHVP